MESKSIFSPLLKLKIYIDYECPKLYTEYYEGEHLNEDLYYSFVMGHGYINVPNNLTNEDERYYFYQEVDKNLRDLEFDIRESVDSFRYSNTISDKVRNYFNNFKNDLDLIKEKALLIRGYNVETVFLDFFDRIYKLLPVNMEETLNNTVQMASLNRRIHAIMFLLNELAVDADKTKIAEFIRYIIGTTNSEIITKNTAVYEKLRQDTLTTADLEELQIIFKPLSIKQIDDLIGSQLKNPIKPKK